MAIIGQDIDQAAQFIKDGGLVGMPTETVYGLAANALNEKAVARIFEVKQRPSFDPLIVHVSSLSMLDNVASDLGDSAKRLLEHFWPGPLTLILKKKPVVPDLVTSGLDTVGVRMPNHPMALRFIEAAGLPIAAPSANPFGYISPTRPSHVDKQLGSQVDYILDGGKCEIGLESTILEVSGEIIKVLRLGGLNPELLEPFCKELILSPHSDSNPLAPGMLSSHYSPRKKLIIGSIDELIQEFPQASILSFSKVYDQRENFVLSKTQDLIEAARNLFHFLRVLDEGTSEIIISEFVPDVGLGKAINDRLKRAASL